MDHFASFHMVFAGLMRGVGVTVLVTLSSLIIGVSLGFALALVRQFAGVRVVNGAIDAYVELFRNIPALSHLFILYFGLASIGLKLQSITAAILGLGLIGGSVTCDIFRAASGLCPGGRLRPRLLSASRRVSRSSRS